MSNSTQNIPTPKPIHEYKDRVPDFGKELEKDYPPVESNSTQNNWDLDTKNWDSPKEWAVWKMWFSPDKLSDTTTERMRRFAKAIVADARKEVYDNHMFLTDCLKKTCEICGVIKDSDKPNYCGHGLYEIQYNQAIDDVLATLKEESDNKLSSGETIAFHKKIKAIEAVGENYLLEMKR